jgi:hypothetical protein
MLEQVIADLLAGYVGYRVIQQLSCIGPVWPRSSSLNRRRRPIQGRCAPVELAG